MRAPLLALFLMHKQGMGTAQVAVYGTWLYGAGWQWCLLNAIIENNIGVDLSQSVSQAVGLRANNTRTLHENMQEVHHTRHMQCLQ